MNFALSQWKVNGNRNLTEGFHGFNTDTSGNKAGLIPGRFLDSSIKIEDDLSRQSEGREDGLRSNNPAEKPSKGFFGWGNKQSPTMRRY